MPKKKIVVKESSPSDFEILKEYLINQEKIEFWFSEGRLKIFLSDGMCLTMGRTGD